MIDDGVKSGVRYILNNFFDGHKQDALDLFTGTYTVKKGAVLPWLCKQEWDLRCHDDASLMHIRLHA